MNRDSGSAPLQVGRGQTRCVDGAVIATTGKTVVRIEADRVCKRYFEYAKSLRHWRRERDALALLAGIDGVPELLEAREDERVLIMSRIPGVQLSRDLPVPDTAWQGLRQLVADILARGVARHSLPVRDLVLRPDGSLGMVDFERVVLQGSRSKPIWLVACMVTRFNLTRLIAECAPHLLTERERRHLGWGLALRNALRRLRRVRGQK